STIEVYDDTNPKVLGVTNGTLYYNCNDTIPDPQVCCQDNCKNVTISYTQDKQPGKCSSDYTLVRTWTCKDACGHQDVVVQNIVITDPYAPEFVVSTIPPTPISQYCGT